MNHFKVTANQFVTTGDTPCWWTLGIPSCVLSEKMHGQITTVPPMTPLEYSQTTAHRWTVVGIGYTGDKALEGQALHIEKAVVWFNKKK